MKLINKQFLKESLTTTATVSLVVMSIFLVIRLVPFMRDAAEGEIPINSVLILLLLNLITYLDLIIPMMGFIAVLMVLNRWCADNEMAVIFASGFSLANFLKPLLLLTLILGSCVALISLVISPWSVRYSVDIENKFKAQSTISGIVPGQFLQPPSGNGIYFAEDFSKSENHYINVFAYGRASENDAVVSAKTAYKVHDSRTGDTFLVLKNGTRYEGVAGDPEYRIVEYETYALRINEGQPPVTVELPLKGYKTENLWGSETPALNIELFWRLSKPIIVPVLMLFALTFSRVNSRQSYILTMFWAFFIYFAYTNMISYIMALMKKGTMQSSSLLWLAHGIFLLFAIYMFERNSRNKSYFPNPFKLNRV